MLAHRTASHEPATPILLTFVHAHVNTRDILASLPKGSWAAAYTCACCHPKQQLVAADDPDIRVLDDGEDWGILSSQRRYQVLVPRDNDGSLHAQKTRAKELRAMSGGPAEVDVRPTLFGDFP